MFRDKVNVVRNMDDDDDSDCKIWITQDKFSQNVANFLPDSLEIFKLEEIEPIATTEVNNQPDILVNKEKCRGPLFVERMD